MLSTETRSAEAGPATDLPRVTVIIPTYQRARYLPHLFAALGAQVHLIQRMEPFPTYAYELGQLAKGHSSVNLKGLLKRV